MRDGAVPTFYLYGEPHRAVGEGFIHLEQLDHRSRPSNWTIRPHAHAELHQIFLIDEGGGAMLADAEQYRFAAPCLLLVPAGAAHGFEWTTGSGGAVLTLATSHLAGLARQHPSLGGLFRQPEALKLGPDALNAVRRAVATLTRELGWSAPAHDAAVHGALLSILVEALRSARPHSHPSGGRPGHQAALVARFRARVDERFRLREPVATHAAALGSSETTLRAACARVAATSPAAILDQRAMLEARRALLYSDLSVSEIGYTLGFADPAYFSRFFARHAGCSPTRFRAGHMKDLSQ